MKNASKKDVDAVNRYIEEMQKVWTSDVDRQIMIKTRSQKVGNALKGRKAPGYVIAALHKGRDTKETRDRISAASKGKVITLATREKQRINGLNRKHSTESKNKMSLSRKGIKLTDEQKSKRDYSHLLKHESPTSKKLSVNGVIYKTITLAMSDLNLSRKLILKNLSDKSPEFINWFFLNEKDQAKVDLLEVKHRGRKVSVNGIIYKKIGDAAVANNCTKACVHYRLNSNAASFKDWFYVNV